VLPDDLLPLAWPGKELRHSYFRFAEELATRRDETQLMEAT